MAKTKIALRLTIPMLRRLLVAMMACKERRARLLGGTWNDVRTKAPKTLAGVYARMTARDFEYICMRIPYRLRATPRQAARAARLSAFNTAWAIETRSPCSIIDATASARAGRVLLRWIRVHRGRSVPANFWDAAFDLECRKLWRRLMPRKRLEKAVLELYNNWRSAQ